MKSGLRDCLTALGFVRQGAYSWVSPFNSLVSLSVRTAGRGPSLRARSVAEAIALVGPNIAITFTPLKQQVDAALVQERIVAILSGFFGALALLLAGLGLYGVTAYAVTRRRTEIGIRMALGAQPGSVVRFVLGRVALTIAAGIVIGAGLGARAAQFVASLLYGLEPRDPLTLIGAAVTLSVVAATAGWVPARRAARVDPAAVLRDS
jgi:putative ABC transport system permease protein